MTLANVISNPDKVFWPDEGYTKLDLARFYQSIFPKLKPYVAGRLLTMERCPDGMLGECFYQKEAPASLPAGTPTKMIHHANRDVRYVVGGPLQTQLALVNLGCIPVHIWQSRAAHERRPDWIVFDLDPGSGAFADAARAGMIVKAALDDLELVSFPKTSGSRGLHVFIPLRVGPDFDEVLLFARNVCERLAAAHPRELTVEARIEERQNRVYLDALRNSFGATVAAPYSVRRRPGAPFSIPLRWSEVNLLSSRPISISVITGNTCPPPVPGRISSAAANRLGKPPNVSPGFSLRWLTLLWGRAQSSARDPRSRPAPFRAKARAVALSLGSTHITAHLVRTRQC